VNLIPPIRVKNLLRYIRNFTLNKFTNKKTPYSAQIELTLRCNATCPFCSIPNIPSSLKLNEMDTNHVKTLIDQIAELGVNALSFTGGEPTLRKDLPELIYHTGVIHDFMNGIATNGYLMPKLLSENGRLEGLDYILLSLDYPSADIHNKRRGLKIFDKVMKTISMANRRDIKVILSTVVMKDNINLLPEICELAENLDCSIELFPCENIIRDFKNEIYPIQNIESMIPNISLWANIVRDLRKKFKNILTDSISVEIVERGGFGGYPDYHQEILRCHVAEAYLFIRYDGFIDYPCKIHPIVSFDTKCNSIVNVYNSCKVREIKTCHDNYPFCRDCRLGCAIASSLPTTWKTLYAKYIQGFLKGNLK
jgi:MoaA/NifB/PqqE/SkfB family radical SAM enzyme